MQVFRRPRRKLGAGPRDSPQEGWGTDARYGRRALHEGSSPLVKNHPLPVPSL